MPKTPELRFKEVSDASGYHIFAFFGEFATGAWHYSKHLANGSGKKITGPYAVDLRCPTLKEGWREGMTIEAFKTLMIPTVEQWNYLTNNA